MAAQAARIPSARRAGRVTRARPTARRTSTASATSSAASGAASDWDRWLAQFRPEAQALWNLMIEINCRLARDAYARELAARRATA